MQIKFYNTNSEPNVLNKNLVEVATLSGNLTSSCNILSPVIEVSKSAQVLASNYVYIADFGRYYYIRSFEIVGKMVRVYMHVDVLYTYRNDIKNSTARVVRSVSHQNHYIIDNMVSTTSDVTNYTRRIGQGFTADDKYLITIGG